MLLAGRVLSRLANALLIPGLLLSTWARCEGQELSETPLCPVNNGLKGVALAQRVEWFKARHPSEEVTVWLFKRTGPFDEKFLGGQLYLRGELQPKPGDETQRDHLPEMDGESWVYLKARNPEKPDFVGLPHLVHRSVSEFYTFRDGGSNSDRLEILEHRQLNGELDFQCWLPVESRWSLDPRRGSLKNFPHETWQFLQVDRDFQELAANPHRIFREAEGKFKDHAAYYYAAEEARSLAAPTILELGSNHWPTVPVGVFDRNAQATFVTIDCNYSGLWLMEKVVEQLRPDWSPRIRRCLADFTETFPLADQSIDIGVSVAAFGMMNFEAPEVLSVFNEIERVLRPRGHFYCDCMDLESRPAWMTWRILQHWKVGRSLDGGRWREICWEKR